MTDKSGKPRDPTDTGHPFYDPAEDPTHPFYEGEKPEVEPTADASGETAYKVGPGFPPNENKWKKGCPSPYPKGRPRKPPTMHPDFKKALEAGLNEKVVVTRDKKEIVLTKGTLGIQQLVNQFAKGDRYARRDLFHYAALLGVDLQAKTVIEEALGLTSQAILDDYVRRRYAELSAEQAPQERVKAPPDLRDDDVTKPDPNEDPAASRQPDLKKTSEPLLDENGVPLPVSHPRYIQAQRERNIAQQKKNQGGS